MSIIWNLWSILCPLLIFVFGFFILAALFVRVIFPKFFLEKHRAAYDLDDGPLHMEVLQRLQKYTIYRLDGAQGEFDCIVLNFWCPKWQSKKILKDLKKLDKVEVI